MLKKRYDYDMALRDYYGWALAKGDVGIEVEVEGYNLPGAPNLWEVHNDGSLRAPRAKPGGVANEYVIRGTIKRDQVQGAVEALHTALTTAPSEPVWSDRCSVHVHVNIQDFTMKQIANLYTLYLIIEDLLVEQCGDTRVGNLFCLRAKDAEYMVEEFARALSTNNYNIIGNADNLKYSALNLACIRRYGSVEFRTMRGTSEPDVIVPWVEMLLNLRDAAKTFGDPVEIVQAFSLKGPARFVGDTFGQRLAYYLLSRPNFTRRMIEGVRLAQDIAYCVPWDRGAVKEEQKPQQPKAAFDWGTLPAEAEWQHELINQIITVPPTPRPQRRVRVNPNRG